MSENTSLRNAIVDAISVTAELFDKVMSKEAATMVLYDLKDYPGQAVIEALARCRKECKRFPTVAEIIERIEDGRPGAEEAWAMLPKDEATSIVWTEEMAEAHGLARRLLPDEIAARMTFKEMYQKLVAKARLTGKAAQWTASLGQDKTGQAGAIEEAVRKGRLSSSQAALLLPAFAPPGKTAALLEGPEEPPADPERVRTVIKDAFKQIRDQGGMNFLDPRRCRHELGPVLRQEEQTLGERWIHKERACERVGLRYLVLYRQCQRCEATVPENFPLKEGA